MHHKQHFEIRKLMSEYTSKGKKSAYKKKQMKRLFAILDDIMQHEGDDRLTAIGKRQIVRYWKRTTVETNRTRREKYSILKRFFGVYNGNILVPEPKVIQCIISHQLQVLP